MPMKKNSVQEYMGAHSRSDALHQRASKIFPADGATHASRIFHPFRPYIVKAEASRKWDVDGNEYIDFVMGHGSLILGHNHPAVIEALRDQLSKGIHFGDNHELELEWAELIMKMIPSAEKIAFCASGQEANLMAIRLARIFTGRRGVLRFRDNFHGWADELVKECSAGIVADEVKVIPFNDLNKLEEELSTRRYAAVLAEGGGAFVGGRVPMDMVFAKAISQVAHRNGTLFILDEVVTGFRESPGGWQAIAEITPDLTALGKALGGGLPAGAVVARSDIMQSFNPMNPPNRLFSQSGSWNGIPIVCSAGIAACRLYLDGDPQKKIRQASSYFRAEGNKILKDLGISGRFYGAAVGHLYLGPIDFEPSQDILPPTRDMHKIMNPERLRVRNTLCLHLLNRGIATMNGEYFFFSAAHTQNDIDESLSACKDSFSAMIDDGALSDYRYSSIQKPKKKMQDP